MSISTCALREEGDPLSAAIRERPFYFYPRPPRGGRRMRKNSMPSPSRFLSTPSARRATLTDVLSMTVSMIFLSTPSARRATSAKRNINGSTINFYPRPPRGGRLKPTQLMSLQNQISIHALREEGDRLAAWQTCFQQDFYPRPPRGGRQAAAFVLALDKLFLSTPSARRATTSFHFCVTLVLISIHALREEGDCPLNGPASPASRFLSTPSARRATR